MANIPYADSTGRLSVEVELNYASDVFLVDSTNFRNYQNGQRFKYFGGHYTESPVNITVNGIGRWYLIVKGGRQYRYRFY